MMIVMPYLIVLVAWCIASVPAALFVARMMRQPPEG